VAQETVEKIKIDIGIKHTVLDTDIADNIAACLADLEMAGISAPDETNPIILYAIKNWCRAVYEDNATEADRFREAYDRQKACLMTASGYGLPEDT
jgi:hypothetical protein